MSSAGAAQTQASGARAQPLYLSRQVDRSQRRVEWLNGQLVLETLAALMAQVVVVVV